MRRYKYSAAGKSVAGSVKKINEDAYFMKKAYFNGSEIMFALVADGMGGVGHGMYASGLVAMDMSCWFYEEMEELFERSNFEEVLEQQWSRIIARTNEILNSGIVPCGGTTLAALLLYEGTYYAAGIGDSRIYLIEKDAEIAETITNDHSYAQQLIEEGRDASSARRNPRGNQLTRCIGAGVSESFAEADFFAGTYSAGDSFLLCTDGQWQSLDAAEIAEIMKGNGAAKAKLNLMCETALKREEQDNITAVAIEVAAKETKAADKTQQL